MQGEDTILLDDEDRKVTLAEQASLADLLALAELAGVLAERARWHRLFSAAEVRERMERTAGSGPR